VRRRFQLSLLLALCTVVLTAAPASSANQRVSLAEAAGGQFPDRVFVLTLPSPQPLAASQLSVRENGRPVTGVTVVPATASSSSQFGVVLVLDASDSMKGKPIAAALEAAQVFVNHHTPTQQVAVVTFNKDTKVEEPFTTDTGEIVRALAHQPTLAFGTHLYDAVAEGVSLLKAAKITAGSVVVLSDGADTGSTASRDEVVKAAKAAHTRVFAIGLRSEQFDPRTLRSLATGTGGDFSEASSLEDLSQIYDQLGTRLAQEYLLRYRSLQNLGSKVHVSVRVKGVAGTARAGYAAPTIPPPVVVSYHRGTGVGFWTSGFTMLVFGLLVIALFGLCLYVLLKPRGRTLQKRLAEFVSLAQASDGTSLTATPRDLRPEGPDSTIEESRLWNRWQAEVELADISTSPTRLAIGTLLAMVVVMWLGALFFGFFAVLLGLLVPFVVWTYIRRTVERKRAKFAEQLPDNLAVLASALRAGHSFVGALSVVVDDAPEPAQSEFARVVADEQLGRPLEDTLDTVAQRMHNPDLAQVALVAALQRQTGGSTAEVLERVVETVRERQDLRRQIKTLTAAGRMSRWVVSALPLVLVVAISVLNPGYLHPLFVHTSGRILLVFATLLVVGGSLAIKRIVDIKV
jgi:tight adherence protein B